MIVRKDRAERPKERPGRPAECAPGSASMDQEKDRMDSKLQQLMARSNLHELIAPPSREVDLNQPVQLAEPV
ncbi:hypothetical protein AB4084_33890, partial [Lysobacter sp. 2RAB21]